MMIRTALLVSLVCFLSACSIFSKKQETVQQPESVDPRLLQKFNHATELLGQEKYQAASKIFEEILQQNLVSDFHLVVLYNSAAALEGMEACTPAAERYRKVVRATVKKNPRLLAQSLFRLGYVYECLNEDAKVISSLLDARKRRKYLPDEIGRAEIPARLAAAYARVGNLKMAEKFLAEAEKGIRAVQLKDRNAHDKRELLAKTLYFMGRIDSQDPDPRNGDQFVQGVRMLQRYLIKSTALDSKQWSPRAANQIIHAYEQVWKLVNRVPVPAEVGDKAIALRKQKTEQLSMAKSALSVLQELKAMRFPDPQEPPVLSSLFKDLHRYEQRFQKFLASHAEALPLTPEARQRQGLRREGRVVEPAPTILEQRAAQKQRLPEQKENNQ